MPTLRSRLSAIQERVQGAEEQHVELAGVDVGMELMGLDEDEGQLGWMNLTRLLGYKTIENRFRNNPRFRNYDSEIIWTGSETICTDPETTIQKLFGPIQKLFAPIQETTPIQKLRSETILPDSETTIQKLFCPIQKLRFRNYFARFRNYDSESVSPDSETILHPLPCVTRGIA